jgi:enoyl-CoA hydratase/3-hydroxyacyl-CoA dehydrogenase
MVMNIDWIKNVLVIGAGTMGHSLAMVFAQGGYEVDLVDIKEDNLVKSKFSPPPAGGD